jgi:hypothetical protein
MIHLKSYQPTHEQMARVEHAIVVNRRRYYALHDAGILDLAEQTHLELDYLNLSYWRNHSQGNTSVLSTSQNSRVPDTIPRLDNLANAREDRR